jgi:hypothetical protein
MFGAEDSSIHQLTPFCSTKQIIIGTSRLGNNRNVPTVHP